ncbi:hypothetical protein JTB14_025501 [Gonioctena quinquepunctata]|nr:hypothetical protein JTB14_025501 [Gonioctena quinquepunctata]
MMLSDCKTMWVPPTIWIHRIDEEKIPGTGDQRDLTCLQYVATIQLRSGDVSLVPDSQQMLPMVHSVESMKSRLMNLSKNSSGVPPRNFVLLHRRVLPL